MFAHNEKINLGPSVVRVERRRRRTNLHARGQDAVALSVVLDDAQAHSMALGACDASGRRGRGPGGFQGSPPFRSTTVRAPGYVHLKGSEVTVVGGVRVSR